MSSIRSRVRVLERKGPGHELIEIVARELADRSDEELEYFAVHGYWPWPRPEPTAAAIAASREKLDLDAWAKLIAGRTNDELELFAVHGIWPGSNEAAGGQTTE